MKNEARRVAVNREVVDRDRGWRWGGIVIGREIDLVRAPSERHGPVIRVVPT